MDKTNSAIMRQKNIKVILSLINKKPLSRAEIAKKTGLTKAAVSIIADDLISRGIISEESVRLNSVGRNPIMLHIRGDALFVPAINITRRDITVGIVNLLGECIKEISFPVSNPEKSLKEAGEAVKSLISETGTDESKIYKTAVVTPGPVDIQEGSILNPPNFEGWRNVPIVSEIQKTAGTEVVFANVSSASAIAEKYFGEGKNTENFMTLLVDDGIGSGIVSGGMLFKGPSEIGHISIKYDGIKCECGNRGCLEKYASIPNLLKNTGLKSWREAVDKNEATVIEREASYLCSAIVTANNIFDLDKVILCGELQYNASDFIRILTDNVKKNMLLKKNFTVSAGKVTSKAKIAASLAIDDFFVR